MVYFLVLWQMKSRFSLIKVLFFLEDNGMSLVCFTRNNARLVLSPRLVLHGVLRQGHQ